MNRMPKNEKEVKIKYIRASKSFLFVERYFSRGLKADRLSVVTKALSLKKKRCVAILYFWEFKRGI